MACGIAHLQLRQFNEETGTVNSRIVCPHLQLVHPFIVQAVEPYRIVRQKEPVRFGRSFSFATTLSATCRIKLPDLTRPAKSCVEDSLS